MLWIATNAPVTVQTVHSVVRDFSHQQNHLPGSLISSVILGGIIHNYRPWSKRPYHSNYCPRFVCKVVTHQILTITLCHTALHQKCMFAICLCMLTVRRSGTVTLIIIKLPQNVQANGHFAYCVTRSNMNLWLVIEGQGHFTQCLLTRDIPPVM